MKFTKDDENYIYEVIGKNVKKYRKLKGWTQEKLAEEIDYSLSFISGIESSYHQTFSLGALWRISQVLNVDFYKLCEDPQAETKSKYISYKCNTCGEETKLPIQIVNIFVSLYKTVGKNEVPTFDCTNNDCDGKISPINPMDI